MGVVYRGVRDGGDFDQEVAIKLIRRGFDFDDIQQRFLRERRILARLTHPGIARFIDGGSAPDGRPWFALEFVHGEPITRWCDRQRLNLAARMRLMLEVCAAVQYAHGQLVVHRDIKPSNVLVDRHGQVRLLDFGIARLLDGHEFDNAITGLGSRAAFTPEYAAPEQFIGESVGVTTDVYALGVMAYVLICGVLPQPVNARHPDEAMRQIRELPPQSLTQAIFRVEPAVQGRPGGRNTEVERRLAQRSTRLSNYRKAVRGDLSRILGKALAKEPERRYATVQSFAEDISAWLRGAPVRASGDAIGYRFRKFVARHRIAVGFAAVALIALVAGFAATAWQMQKTRVQRDEALAEVRRSEGMRQYLMLMFRDVAAADQAHTDVREVFRQGVERLFERFADQPEAGQETALMLSDLYLQLADVEGAVPLLERLLAWPGIKANPGVLAQARYNLAQAELVRGNIARAQTLLDQAQAHWAATVGIVQQALLNESRNLQSRLQRSQGRTEHALATLRAAIVERERLLGAHDAESGAQYVSLAIGLMQIGRLDEAEAVVSEGLGVYAQLGLAESDGGMAALNARANIALAAGRPQESIEDLRRVVSTTRALYGQTPKLATALNNLGIVLMRSGQAHEAAPVMEEALRIARASAGERSRLAVALRGATAEAWASTGRVEAAAPLVEDALEIARTDFATDPLLIGTAHRVRAKVRIEQRLIAQAHEDLDQASAYFRAAGTVGEPYLQRVQALRQTLVD